MIIFRTFTSRIFLNNIKKRYKHVFGECHVSAMDMGKEQNHSAETLPVKMPAYRKIAMQENFDIYKFLVKPQDAKEVESIFKEIAQGDAEVEKQLQLLLYEISLKREEEQSMPNILLKQHWEELLNFRSEATRRKYLQFLFKKEKKRESEKIKCALRKRDLETHREFFTVAPHIYYGLQGYSMFIRIYKPTLYNIQDVRAMTNKLFASPILYDCSYQEYMNEINTKYCAKQLAHALQINRSHQHPCSLHLVNLNKNDSLMKNLQLFLQNIEEINSPLEISEKSYLDLYPKERLVYLTPHCKNELLEFNDDDIYIIGAYVDKGLGIQASLAKAKENGLRMAKLPLDSKLLWQKGTKSLTLNNMLNILLDLRFYRNWGKALQSIPARNLRP